MAVLVVEEEVEDCEVVEQEQEQAMEVEVVQVEHIE